MRCAGLAAAGIAAVAMAGPAAAIDRPFGTSRLYSPVYDTTAPLAGEGGQTSTGAPFSKAQIQAFRCASAPGQSPTSFVDMSCNTELYGQDYAPDNELAVAVDPTDPNHLVAGSNDYFYRFNNSTGARQAMIVTGFFTSFDGGANWIDGQIPIRTGRSDDVTLVFADRGTPNPNASDACLDEPVEAPAYDPCEAGPSSDTDVYAVRSTDGGETWSDRLLLDGGPEHAWFPWADHRPDGTLVFAYDRDVQAAGGAIPTNDTFRHVLTVGAAAPVALGPEEHIDVSVTHWSGQYVDVPDWPRVCGPVPYSDGPLADPLARGKDCNQFHGDYTGMAVDGLGRAHVVWTGLNRAATSPQLDPYVGGPHDGFAQDAMYARRGG